VWEGGFRSCRVVPGLQDMNGLTQGLRQAGLYIASPAPSPRALRTQRANKTPPGGRIRSPSAPAPSGSRRSSSGSRPFPVHSAHGNGLFFVHYPHHPLYGQQLQVEYTRKLPPGEFVFCRLPDQSITSIPLWMTRAEICSQFSSGPPQLSLDALLSLHDLLGAHQAPLAHDKRDHSREVHDAQSQVCAASNESGV